MENQKNGKKKTVLLVALFSLSLLASMVGATFAYFSVTIQGNNTSSSVIIKSSALGINYNSGGEIFAEGVKPQWSDSKTLTVTNTGDSVVIYTLAWDDVYNDFAVKSELQYNIVGSGQGAINVVAGTPAPSINGNIASNVNINPGVTHQYVLTISFPDLGTDQNDNQGKTFAARIIVKNVGQP